MGSLSTQEWFEIYNDLVDDKKIYKELLKLIPGGVCKLFCVTSTKALNS